ncbi:hypothetical protein [Lentzea jiangxiensis]|uniref:Uncharacterized protein n=1 Tax=Lentzea jiangxiensis TaxID=641025 RepID=A0A1H0WVT3_9PSEU|nr:hypothetical protein [Lentzea jiangxiensis]SDP94709.1 hypothetical protein SAMN05421507_12429 [Lentzea jiangxiensis]
MFAAVEPETSGEDAYFPERELARFLNAIVYAFPRTGVRTSFCAAASSATCSSRPAPRAASCS